MNGRIPKRLRRALFEEMMASGTILHSGYEIKTVRRSNGERGQMLVCTGFRKLYREMKRDLREARRPHVPVQPEPEAVEKARVRKRAARARKRVEWRRRAAEIRAAREERA